METEVYKILIKESHDEQIDPSRTSRIYLNCDINNLTIKEEEKKETGERQEEANKPEQSDIKKCIFINCQIQSLKISHLKVPIKTAFINCKIKNLCINESFIQAVEFIGCKIKDSKITNSILPGIRFSQHMSQDLDAIIKSAKKGNKWTVKSKIRSSVKSSSYEPLINDSKFLFCDLNEIQIDNMTLSGTAIKHCNLEDIKIYENVKMEDMDIRGTKMVNSDLGKCQLKNIRFNKSKFPVELVAFFIGFIEKIKFYLHRLKNREIKNIFIKSPEQKRLLKMNNWRKVRDLRQKIKKALYKGFLSFVIDSLSSTDFKQIKLKEESFLEERYLLWHIQECETIHNLNIRRPFFSSFMFLTSNYRRSFSALLLWIITPIFFFSFAYSSFGKFCIDPSYIQKNKIKIINEQVNVNRIPFFYFNILINGCIYPFYPEMKVNLSSPEREILELIDEKCHPRRPFNLSCKIFINSCIHPLQPDDPKTKSMVIIETFLGYFALGILLSILTVPFSRRSPFDRD